jgi:uncharacterized membrane protein YqgA involved in biofilm formation
LAKQNKSVGTIWWVFLGLYVFCIGGLLIYSAFNGWFRVHAWALYSIYVIAIIFGSILGFSVPQAIRESIQKRFSNKSRRS